MIPYLTASADHMVNSLEIKTKRISSLAARQKAVKIKELLDSCTDQIPTLTVLESEFNLSRNYLQIGFQEIYGTTIGNYAKSIKLKLIKKLLKDYTLTLDSIAIRTGYNGGEALSRFFKIMEGISPGQWRRDYLNSSL
jgi:AraC family transcriptional regulator, arabinose operon regulatory protein